jgi:hypothetical protein
VAAHVQAVSASERTRRRDHHVLSVHEAADRTPTTLYLNDRWRHGVHGVRQLIREIGKEFVVHVRIVAELKPARITQKGGV